jgi:hypothetical protein
MKFRHLLTLLTSEIGVYECPVPNKLFQKNKCNGNRRHWYRFRRRVGDALPLATVLGIDQSNQASQIDAATITKVEWRQFHEICQSINDFNQDVKRNKKVILRRLGEVSESPFWREANGTALPPRNPGILGFARGCGDTSWAT